MILTVDLRASPWVNHNQSVLQMRELKFREVKWLAQGDPAGKQFVWDQAQIFQIQVLFSLYSAAFENLHDLRKIGRAHV